MGPPFLDFWICCC